MRSFNRRQFIKSLVAAGGAALAAGSLSCAAKTPAAAKRPNIVMIVADDLGWKNVGYQGGRTQTPNIDRIARDGVELDRFYVTPLCSPTRAGLMTGRHPLRMGIGCGVITPWRTHGMPADERIIPEVLAKAGYSRRGCFGKWHLGHTHVRQHPLSRGFTHYYGCYNGAIDYFTRKREKELDWHRGHAPAREEGYATHLITDEAVKFIKNCKADEPFFAYVPYTAPHSPMQVPEKYLAMYPKLTGKPQAYAAMVTVMDEGIGKILAAVDDLGVADDTFVLFFSDNGAGIGGVNTPLRGRKATVFEGGVRAVAAVRWPNGGLRGGKKVTDIMGFIDVLPTLMCISGIKASGGKPLDGLDVLDAMTGKSKIPARPWYSYVGIGGKNHLAIMDGPWKFIYIGPPILETDDPLSQGRVYLFRINDDPNEKTDLADKHPDVVKTMLAKLKEYRSWHGKTCLNEDKATRRDFTAPKDWILPGTKPEDLKE
ncbi:MAG: sulfatase-like hydrolase/transferase [bacterium]|nr:sulfatase-like hydrolase/transferase [bacterium]